MDFEEIVLLAEDDTLVRHVMTSFLSAALPSTFKVIATEDGEQACSLIREYRGRIAMVITDYNMPKMNGEGVIKTAIDHHLHNIVLCSGGGSPLDGVFKLVSQVQTMRFQFLMKPITMAQIKAAVLPLITTN